MKFKKAIEIIKQFEGCKLKAYKDTGGVWTIGYGSTGPDIKENVEWTQLQADYRFEKHFSAMAVEIQGLLKISTTEGQICALCSLVYNIGINAFKTSTLLRLMNENKSDPKTIADQFLRWNKDNGKVVQGLTNRRKLERELFLS